MPKMKTRRAVAKRFSATANGKLKRKRGNLRHLLVNKTGKAKDRNVQTDYVHQSDIKRIKRALPGI
jgi:large subunit ribosomal protein L35